MDTQEILKRLEFNDSTFPRKALEDAIVHQDSIIPKLLEIIEQAAHKAEELMEQESYMAHIYAIFLLAQFREKRAYPLIVDFFSIPGRISLNLTGDIVTEDLGRILASVSYGDISLITTLVENENANEYVRSAALEGLLTMVACGEKSRDDIMAYYKSLFQEKLERKYSHVWNSLISCSTRLCPEEVYADINRAYKEDLVDPFFINLENVDKIKSSGREKVLDDLRRDRRYTLIEDTIREMVGLFQVRKTTSGGEQKEDGKWKCPLCSKREEDRSECSLPL